MAANRQPSLFLHSDALRPDLRTVDVHELDADLLAFLDRHPHADRLLKRLLRVRVVEIGAPAVEELPDILGDCQLLEDRVRFTPHFPFESGVRYRASFDPRPLSRPELSEVLTLEFALPREANAEPTEVRHIFPSTDSLPGNLLRFYVSFSNPMQHGRAAEEIRVLHSDGRPASDVLYRPPVELWDKSMHHLTILLDPGRLKRGVGPNRKLGPPLEPDRDYKLAIGAGMIDRYGSPLRESSYKTFRVTKPIREPIAPERWEILRPATASHQPLRLVFPRPLDWALLWHAITIESQDGQPIPGRVGIDQDERRWSFTPRSPWVSSAYRVRITAGLEDVCGNDLLAPFDSPLRSHRYDRSLDAADRSIPFHLVP